MDCRWHPFGYLLCTYSRRSGRSWSYSWCRHWWRSRFGQQFVAQRQGCENPQRHKNTVLFGSADVAYNKRICFANELPLSTNQVRGNNCEGPKGPSLFRKKCDKTSGATPCFAPAKIYMGLDSFDDFLSFGAEGPGLIGRKVVGPPFSWLFTRATTASLNFCCSFICW